MERLVVLVAATVGGSLGWWVGARIGFTTAFCLSFVGTGAGVYLARRWVREHWT
jgi:hypothetical protein